MKSLLEIAIKILLFLIPSLGMLAGLSVAALVTFFLLALLLLIIKNNVLNYQLNFKNHKIEILFTSWCFIACFYAINPVNSFFTFLQVFIILFLGIIVNNNIEKLPLPKNLKIYLFSGVLSAILLFCVEYYTNGLLTKIFWAVLNPLKPHHFFLYVLDRGCALLSLTSWVVIGILVNNNKKKVALLFYILTLYLLGVSDSLASFVGFTFGSMIFTVSKITHKIFFQLIATTVIIGSLLTPVITAQINYEYILDKYNSSIPDSAQHRLYIWQFVANKIIERPLLGYGFGSSKYIKIKNDEIIIKNNMEWSPLPLHPHNNILQIMLELGLIGLLLLLCLIYKILKQINKVKNNNYQAIAYACFVNYFTIGMISYSIWQAWWVATSIWGLILMKLFIKTNIMIDKSQ